MLKLLKDFVAKWYDIPARLYLFRFADFIDDPTDSSAYSNISPSERGLSGKRLRLPSVGMMLHRLFWPGSTQHRSVEKPRSDI